MRSFVPRRSCLAFASRYTLEAYVYSASVVLAICFYCKAPKFDETVSTIKRYCNLPEVRVRRLVPLTTTNYCHVSGSCALRAKHWIPCVKSCRNFSLLLYQLVRITKLITFTSRVRGQTLREMSGDTTATNLACYSRDTTSEI